MKKTFLFSALIAAAACAGGKGLTWPAGRLLPAFSAPAAVIDCIDATGTNGAERDLFASLEGIVNRTQPRLAVVACNAAEGKFTWLDLHQLSYKLIDGYDAIAKYKKEITGLVVTDPQLPDTLNLATTLAGLNNELICAPQFLPALTNAPCHFKIKDDLRGKFTDKYQVYQFLHDHCWRRCTHRILTGFSGNGHGDLRDYIVAAKSAVVWLNPADAKDAAMLSQFFASLKPAHAVYMGWWADEGAGLRFAGRFGVPVFASDFFENGSLFSGVVQPIVVPAIPPAPPLENKIYVSFFISDGDNAQYMQHHLKCAWANPARGSVPIG